MFNFADLPPVDRQRREVMTDKQFIEREITRFKASKRRREMYTGERYYQGFHDILSRKRTAIGENGELTEIKNLPNNRVVDNQYRKMVKQKANYLCGQPLTFQTENDSFADALKDVLGVRFNRLVKNVAVDCLNEGIVWLFPTFDDDGQLIFKKFKGHEIIPGWRDADHTILDYAIRLYTLISYSGSEEQIVEKVEVFDETGISYFQLDGGKLTPEAPFHDAYFTVDGIHPFNWTKIPLIPFKRDAEEMPLIRNVKCLQDGLNSILSNFENNMEEDARNTILILVNYDGENLGEFRKNLSQYGAVKVRTVDGAAGDLKTLEIEVNGENYKTILEIFKKAIIENAMGFDAKDDRITGEPNQMNIQSMYNDIDLDANDMEAEFQTALEELIWFVRCHIANVGAGDFEKDDLEIIFNRDLPMVESEVISNIRQSVGLLSEETLIAQHPWVDDPKKELERVQAQKKKELEEVYNGAFPGNPKPPNRPLNKGVKPNEQGK